MHGEQARKLYRTILEKSHHPERAERLRENFEGPNYYELNKDKAKVHNKAYNDTHREEIKVRDKEH